MQRNEFASISAAVPSAGESSNATLQSVAEMRSLRRADGGLARAAANASAVRLEAGKAGDLKRVIADSMLCVLPLTLMAKAMALSPLLANLLVKRQMCVRRSSGCGDFNCT
jgi:hypothetical protein